MSSSQDTGSNTDATLSLMRSTLPQFAASLRTDAERIDIDSHALDTHFAEFQRSGLSSLGSRRRPLTARQSFEFLSDLAESSGAFAFTALQQWVANQTYPVTGEDPWPRLGVAYGHLRNAAAPAPIWKDGRVNGSIPWLTGAGILDRGLLGVRLPDKREAYAWIDLSNRPEFRHSKSLDLIACTGASTVGVSVDRLTIDEGQFVRIDAPGTLSMNDANGIIFQTPLMIGCMRASLRSIEESPRVEAARKRRCTDRVNALIGSIFEALESGDSVGQGPVLRALAGDLCCRLSRLAAMAEGGRALANGHPAQRLYRESLVFSLMAQTDLIINQAFDSVFDGL